VPVRNGPLLRSCPCEPGSATSGDRRSLWAQERPSVWQRRAESSSAHTAARLRGSNSHPCSDPVRREGCRACGSCRRHRNDPGTRATRVPSQRTIGGPNPMSRRQSGHRGTTPDRAAQVGKRTGLRLSQRQLSCHRDDNIGQAPWSQGATCSCPPPADRYRTERPVVAGRSEARPGDDGRDRLRAGPLGVERTPRAMGLGVRPMGAPQRPMVGDRARPVTSRGMREGVEPWNR
jgi:hypothetical protein